uniref:Serpentine Receptor, class T n=1 Tax=Panagrellus redivivus TaxID=6233 RepID=A0A7E4ZPS9_PANRE
MAEAFDYVLLGCFVATFFVYLYVAYITSRLLWHCIIRRHTNSIEIVPILTTHVVSWWLCAISAIILAAYNIVYWRPEPIYNNVIMFSLFLPAQLALNCVHISQFFITLERILIMKSANPIYNQKLLLAACVLINIGVATFIGVLFTLQFAQNGVNDESCVIIICMVGMDTYLVSYHVSNAISAVNLIASLYFLFLFRKTTITVNTHGKQAAKKQNMIKFTICVDICLDIFPQIVTVVLSLMGSPIGPYVATLQRVLFTFCGIFVNQRFYNVFVTHESSFAKTTSVALKTQSKVFQTSKRLSVTVPKTF